MVIEKTDEYGRKVLESDGHTFELVDKITKPYVIWNIGANIPDGYLPPCKLKPIQPFEGAKCIETESLRAIKMDGAQVILAAIGGGQETIPEMERYIMRYKNARPGTYSYRKVQRMKKALPYMQGLWD